MITTEFKTDRPTLERDALYERYRPKILSNGKFERRHVSFQDNKHRPVYNWFKYKEGFSATLVREILSEHAKPGVLLDPFAGLGTSLFVGRSLGWDAIGIELLPVGFNAIEARLASEVIKKTTFKKHLDAIESLCFEDLYDVKHALKHIPITDGAFPKKTENAIAGFRSYCAKQIRQPHLRRLFDFAAFSILESVSYTRKDGQYLRWDYRAQKARTKGRFDKGDIQNFNQAIKQKLKQFYYDLEIEGKESLLFDSKQDKVRKGVFDIRKGSCLDLLPLMRDQSVDLVITSPPYCNRYDYTRTYALELVYLNFNADQVKRLRQQMLSCTVENREKSKWLNQVYAQRSNPKTFEKVRSVFCKQTALHEGLNILESLGRQKRLNNANIPNMVKNYFFEMCFVIYELSRILKPGGKMFMVNDNVRYAGEEIPVDLILSDFARKFGLSVNHIWTLGRGKGNSSQQMGLHGRTELRKCIYVWHKK